MKILVNGIQSNLRFSSAHVIPGHESCGYIHGHKAWTKMKSGLCTWSPRV